jgi:hypothetical protein
MFVRMLADKSPSLRDMDQTRGSRIVLAVKTRQTLSLGAFAGFCRKGAS